MPAMFLQLAGCEKIQTQKTVSQCINAELTYTASVNTAFRLKVDTGFFCAL